MEKQRKYNFTILTMMVIAVVFSLFGYSQGFDSGKQVSAYMNSYITESQDFIFQCNGYSEPYNSCDHALQNMNITGHYCNGTLVCGNALR